MDFEYLIPKNARLRAHILQRSNLRLGRKFVDATNKKEKAVTYTVHDFPIVMQIWAFEVMPEIWDRFARRLGHQSPRLLSWTCTKQPQQRTYDAFFKNIKVSDCVSCTRFPCVVSRYICGDTQFLYVAAHVSTTLRPIEAELGQPYISTLLSFEDCIVPALDDVARDIIPSQLHPEPLASGENVGNSRGECALVSNGRGSEDNDESGDSDDEGAGEEIGGDKSGDSNGEASDEGTVGTVRMSTLVHRRLGHIPLPHAQTYFSHLCTLQILYRNGGETDPIPECAKPQVHGRGFSPLPIDHDEDMDNEMQERNGGAGMESELALNGDDDDVASGGSEKCEGERVASPTGVAEADGGCGMDSEPEMNSHDDEVPSSGSGNLLDKLITSASGVAEVDGKLIAVEN
ncbi:Hypothetical predicted protein [Olea europaea subsp. europaea]|uniref:Uncharacterized protein n=1 Tax=Olea europaea subsp. europaea TaxID=158383 RepID=A0A8S0UIG9_OLEEU|nr:Hypothetical predicted protein [Olea europaea subsp. europaea]